MIDLDHLDTLDDAAPPDPDLAQVYRRASRIRRRNGFAAAAIGAAVLAVVVIAVAAYPRGTTDVDLVTSSPTTSSGTLPNGLHAELTLDTPSVALGNNIRATLVVRNDSGARVDLTDEGVLDCDFKIREVRLDGSGIVAFDGGNDLVCRGIPDDLAPGDTRTYPVTLSTESLDIPTQTFHLTLENAG